MSLKSRRAKDPAVGTRRRGRPPKHRPKMDHLVSTTSIAVTAAQASPVATMHPEAVKPREEQSYKDYFPDLNIRASLAIVRIKDDHPFSSLDPKSGSELSSPETSEDDKLSDDTPAPLAPRTLRPSSTVKMSTRYENNPVPLILHEKEGDTFQALSTRPQYHPASHERNETAVNLSLLPKPSFSRVVSDDDTGFDDDSDAEESSQATGDTAGRRSFHRPENHYIHYIEPSESELFDTVEYDMDEQDEAWLKMINVERRKNNLGEVSGDLFEGVIDQLEKEWFDLVKDLPKQVSNDEPSLPEDSSCAICDDGECENSNAIVFCDGCNLAVHQDCYGIPYIPEGQWLCRKCMVSPENPVSCIFCPNEGGAFKQTNTNNWGHLLCAIWIPEVGVSNSVYMEPIDNIENIPRSRWKLSCYICRKRQGACIQCDNKNCFIAFHVSCARWARLCMRMKSHGTHYDGVVLKAYCDRHTPRDYKTDQFDVTQCVMDAQRFLQRKNSRTPRRRYVDEDLLDEAALADGESRKKKHKRSKNVMSQLLPSSKAARAHQHHYTAGAPVAPEAILTKLENLQCVRQAQQLRKKPHLITTICRYWSLKRESRRGAPLLKRLHLEPWTASSSLHKQSEVEKAHRASAMMSLRTDLEKVRMLSEQVQKREKQKLERIRKQKAYLETILFPLEYMIKPVIEQLLDMDKKELFRYPVTPDMAPDYSDIIKNPMAFSNIFEKLAEHAYSSLEDIEDDLLLIWKNSMTYNKPDTAYYKLAQRLEQQTHELMALAKKDYQNLKVTPQGQLNVEIHPEIFCYSAQQIPSPEELEARRQKEEQQIEEEAMAKAAVEGKARLAAERAAKRAKADEKKVATRHSPRRTPSQGESSLPRLRTRSADKVTTRQTRALNELRRLRSSSVQDLRSQDRHEKKSRVSRPSHAPKQPVKPPQPARHKRAKADSDSEMPLKKRTRRAQPRLSLTPGEVVWARVKGFPAHPAKIIDPRHTSIIPDRVLNAKRKKDSILVEFYKVPDQHRWGWVEKEDVHVFGSYELDITMLQKAKSTRRQRRVLEAKDGYKYACKIADMDPKPQLEAVFTSD